MLEFRRVSWLQEGCSKMKLTIDKKILKEWCELVVLTDTTFHKVRKELFEKLTKELKEEEKGNEDNYTIAPSTFNTLKSYLISRNDRIDDSKELAFNVAVMSLSDAIDETNTTLGRQSRPETPTEV
jgi:20S proteasome alpha/beta subunit